MPHFEEKVLDFLEMRRYNSDMEKPYLTQYCNLSFEWQSMGIDIDTATESQQVLMQELGKKAIEQSGLTASELTLVSMCRQHRIFVQVNTYAHKLTRLTP